jgi:hypothetical protein
MDEKSFSILKKFEDSNKGISNKVKIEKLNLLIKFHADKNEFFEAGVLQKRRVGLNNSGGFIFFVFFKLKSVFRKHHKLCLQVGDLFLKCLN